LGGLVLLVCAACGGSPDASKLGGPSAGGSSSTGGSTAGGTTSTGGSVGTAGGSAATSGGSGGSAPADGGTENASGGNGATGGTQTLPDPELLPCDDLPSEGDWENISPDGLSDTTALIADPFEDGTVWLGTTDGGLFKSTDCGANFVHVSTGTLADEMNGSGGLLSMAVDPVDQGTMYVFKYGGHGVLKSTNGGVDFFQTMGDEIAEIIPSKYIDSISMDPTNHLHLLTSNHVTCNAPYDPTCMSRTTDGGETWTVFEAPPYTSWEEGAGVWLVNEDIWIYAGLHTWLTTDAGANWDELNPDPAEWWGSNSGEVESHSIPQGPDGTYYLTQGQGVVKSTDGGHTWDLIPNSGGRKVGFIIGDTKMYAIDQWNPSLHWAPIDDDETWTQMDGPPIPDGQGCPYLDYDKGHHILYASCYGAGAWRISTQ
jgi:hypothetical protein